MGCIPMETQTAVPGDVSRYRSDVGTHHCCFESFTSVGRCWNDVSGDMIACDSVDTLCLASVQSFHRPVRYANLMRCGVASEPPSDSQPDLPAITMRWTGDI
jgi:hypothetical protein